MPKIQIQTVLPKIQHHKQTVVKPKKQPQQQQQRKVKPKTPVKPKQQQPIKPKHQQLQPIQPKLQMVKLITKPIVAVCVPNILRKTPRVHAAGWLVFLT